MSDLITISNLCKRFIPSQSCGWRVLIARKKSDIVACDNINLTVRSGELMGLVGPNGSGKTTLIRILAGVILPDSGKVSVAGKDVVKNNLGVRSSLGLVTGENRNFYVRLTARENLLFFAHLYKRTRQDAQKRIKELSELLELDAYLDRMFQENSTGIRQRITLARGLLTDASVMLLDEPTKHLDAHIAQKVRLYIKEHLVRHEKRTVLMASHSLKETGKIADRISILHNGCLATIGTLDELRYASGNAHADLDALYNFYIRD